MWLCEYDLFVVTLNKVALCIDYTHMSYSVDGVASGKVL